MTSLSDLVDMSSLIQSAHHVFDDEIDGVTYCSRCGWWIGVAQEVPCCRHVRRTRGDDVPRQWGSFRTEVCSDCGWFRLLTHYGEPHGGWQPASGYADAVAPTEDA